MTATDWKPVATALLGSWPNQVAQWGRDGIAAYCSELGARGMSPNAALVALRSCGAEQKFPPSAPELAGLARQDPSEPTFDEAFALIYGRRGVLKARPPYLGRPLTQGDFDRAALERAGELHPRVGDFVRRYGLGRLRALEVDHPEFGGLKRKELRMAYEQIGEALEGREVAALASGRREGMARLDPLAALGRPSSSVAVIPSQRSSTNV